MKEIIILLLGFSIFLMNIVLGNECIQKHDTHNIRHQFYEALVETPKDAIVKGAVATKDLGKDVVAAVVTSNAPHELKEAAKELVVDTPIKTAEAIKNGAVKAYDSTKKGAKVAYNTVIKKPAHKIKDVAKQIANSDFVQGTKESVVEIGEQLAEAGHDIVNATKYGAHKVYHVVIEKPVGAVKAAANYLAHADDKDDVCANCEICVMVLPAPLLTANSLEQLAQKNNGELIIPNVATIAVMPTSWIKSSVQIITSDNVPKEPEDISIEFLTDIPCQIDDGYSLSENTIQQLAKAYQAIQADLAQQQ